MVFGYHALCLQIDDTCQNGAVKSPVEYYQRTEEWNSSEIYGKTIVKGLNSMHVIKRV